MGQAAVGCGAVGSSKSGRGTGAGCSWWGGCPDVGRGRDVPSSAAKQATSASCLLNHVAKAISRRKSLNWRGHCLGLDAFQKRRANWSGVGGEGGESVGDFHFFVNTARRCPVEVPCSVRSHPSASFRKAGQAAASDERAPDSPTSLFVFVLSSCPSPDRTRP